MSHQIMKTLFISLATLALGLLVGLYIAKHVTLSVEVSNKAAANSQQGSASTTAQEWGQYKQTIQLPSAVQASQMKVDHKDHELVIILPKA
jgi:hypothetical protein